MNGVTVFSLLALSIPLFVILTRNYYHKQQQQQQHSEDNQDQEEQEQDQEEEEREKEQDKVWSWAELDRDVLGEIVSRLCLTDQARFRAVCTNWLAAAHPVITNAKPALPWYGYQNPSNIFEYQIYDPLSSSPENRNYPDSRCIIPWSQFGIPTSASVNVGNVQHNWVYMCFKKDNLFFRTSRWVVFFSPFTKTIISLPKFDYSRRFLGVATFSTLPDSQDCVFCVVDAKHFHEIVIVMYRNGDKEWTIRRFKRHRDFPPCRVAVGIIRGILYMSCALGQVASYNISNGEFNYDRLLQDEFIVQNYCSRPTRACVLDNDELMLLCYNVDVEDDATFPCQQFLRKYDPLLKVWIPVRTLGDYALFFHIKVLKFSLVNTKDSTCNRVLPNKVYRLLDDGWRVYSLEDGQLVHFKSLSLNFLEDCGDDLPENKYNYAIPDTRSAYWPYWLEAPRVRSSSDNQEVRTFRDEGEQAQYVALDDESEFPS